MRFQYRLVLLNCFKTHFDLFLLGCTLCLFLLASTYLVRGFSNALRKVDSRSDLYYRYQEQWYVTRGQNPYDVLAFAIEVQKGTARKTNAASVQIDDEVGPIRQCGYPPWAFFSAFLFVPSFLSWAFVHTYFVAINFLCLIVMGAFAYGEGRSHGPLASMFLVSAVLAIGTTCYTVGECQYGLIINAFLFVMYWAEQRKNSLLSGISFALALTKPNISALFGFIMPVGRRYAPIIIATIYLGIASSVVWFLTGTGPLEMLVQMRQENLRWAHRGSTYGPMNVAIESGLSVGTSVNLFLFIGACITPITLFLIPENRLCARFAACSILGRLWTYHKMTDNVMLVFLLLYLGRLLFERPCPHRLLIFVIVGFTLWVPPRIQVDRGFAYAQLSIWSLCLLYAFWVEVAQNKVRGFDAVVKITALCQN
jgi:hypothetical protein